MLENLVMASEVIVESVTNPSVAFDVALVVWSTITISLMGLTAIAGFFAKSWKHRVDKITEINTKGIEQLKTDHNKCALIVAQDYVDKSLFNKQVDHCVTLQQGIFDKIELMRKEIADTKIKLVESEFRIIKEIKNGNKSSNK